MERLRHKSTLQEHNCFSMPNNGITAKHTSLESQRRRPSSIAEQAMRKLGIGSNHQRTDPSVSPRHYTSIMGSNRNSDMDSLVASPLPSMTTLRDTTIREQIPSKDSSYFRGCSSNNNFGFPPTNLLSRDNCNSPFLLSSNMISNSGLSFNNPMGSHDNNTILPKEHISSKLIPNRFLSSGIDQRIMKQSTEDCRRLLQQVSYKRKLFLQRISIQYKFNLQAIAVSDTSRNPSQFQISDNSHLLYAQQQQPQPQQQQPQMPSQLGMVVQSHTINPQIQTVQPPAPASSTLLQSRILTTSNSFDSKSNLAGFATSFQMSVEASKLFQTLQQSPLPLPSTDVINC